MNLIDDIGAGFGAREMIGRSLGVRTSVAALFSRRFISQAGNQHDQLLPTRLQLLTHGALNQVINVRYTAATPPTGPTKRAREANQPADRNDHAT